MKDKGLHQSAMELAFRKAVVDGITADKDVIKAALFGKKPEIKSNKKASKKHES